MGVERTKSMIDWSDHVTNFAERRQSAGRVWECGRCGSMCRVQTEGASDPSFEDGQIVVRQLPLLGDILLRLSSPLCFFSWIGI